MSGKDDENKEDDKLTVTITIDGMAHLTQLLTAIYAGGNNSGAAFPHIPGMPTPSRPVSAGGLFDDILGDTTARPDIPADGSEVFGQELNCPGHEYENQGEQRGITTFKCKHCPHVLTIPGQFIDKEGDDIDERTEEPNTEREESEPEEGGRKEENDGEGT